MDLGQTKASGCATFMSCSLPNGGCFFPMLTNGTLLGLRGVGLDSSNDESISTPSLPNTFLGGGCPNTFQRPWLMEVCLGGPQTSMYSQGIRKTSDMFFGRLMMFNERRQLDITKPPLEMMLQRVPRKRSPETNWANFAGFWFPIHFWGKGCG